MVKFRKPSSFVIQQFLDTQRNAAFTYEGVGSTAGQPPAGYVVDHTRVPLGEGEAAFVAARDALRRWEQFNLDFVAPGSTTAPIEVGQHVAIVGRAIGLWWLNACRIV